MYELLSVSSLNIRRGKTGMVLSDPISFRCSSGCGCRLGKTTFAMVRMQYRLGDGRHDVVLCGKCIDLLADLIRHGPMVIGDLEHWRLRSRVARVSLVNEYMFCFKCLGKMQTHIFMKYDDMYDTGLLGPTTVSIRNRKYGTVRVCAKCAISYLQMMLAQRRRLATRKFEYRKANVVVR